MSSKIKVLQVIPKLGYGGAETGCYDLAHYLYEKDCKSYIVTSGGELLKFVKKDKVKIFRLPVQSKNPLIMIFNSIVISILVLIFNIDIIHARSRAPAWSCFFSSLLTRRKFVTTFHGTYSFKNNIKKYYNSIMLKSNLTIAGSNFIFDHINQNYGSYIKEKNKLMVIFRGINLEYFNQKNVSEKKLNKLRALINIDQKSFVILLPGRITPWKGQENFIEALNILIEDFNITNFQAIILGSDQGRKVYTKKLTSLIERYSLSSKVRFVNPIKEMPLAYSLADLIVSTSIKPEAFGRVAVEAQAMQKPIVASNLGGSKETIINSKSGFLFKYDDPRELAKAIHSVISMGKDSLHKIGNEGRRNVSKKFDVDKMCHSTFTEYKKLLKL